MSGASSGNAPGRKRLGPCYRILAFDVDPREIAELLVSLDSLASVEVLEEDSLHEALQRLATRRIDLLVLDSRRSPGAVLSRLASAATADNRTGDVLAAGVDGHAEATPPGARILEASEEPVAQRGVRLQAWIDVHLAAAAKGRARLRVTGRTGYGTARKGRVLS